MRKSTALNWSVVTLFLCGLLLSATIANAHNLEANATVTCTDYTINFLLSSLQPGIPDNVSYQLTPSCNPPVPPVGGNFTIMATDSTAEKSVSGNITLTQGCTVTGTATLTFDSEVKVEPIRFDGDLSKTVDCPSSFQCVIPEVIISGTSWNKFPIPAGTNPVVWVHAHIGKPSGIPTNAISTVLFTGVSINIAGTVYPLPDGLLTFDPAAPSTITTTFNSTLNRWETLINPANMSDEMFFTGAAIPVTPAIAAGGKANFSFAVQSSAPKLSFPWQWSAAVYTFWPMDWNQAKIQPFHKSLHAGTPLNTEVQKSLIQGPRGGGGSNFTGSWSATGKGICP